MSSEAEILQLSKDWLAIDVNPTTRSQIQSLLESKDYDKLQQLLSSRILFGTAGLRARMEAGFSKMNDVTVLQASQGLARYILETRSVDNILQAHPTVVVGHDHRHNSARFAALTAAAFLHYGFKVYFLGPEIVPTPLVPFAVDHFKAEGGVMVTASHNPKDDNGYKVYWKNGCQIVPPHDSGIQNMIMNSLTPFFGDGEWNTEAIFKRYEDSIFYVRNEISKLYTETVAQKLIKKKVSGFKCVYTAMHGVGTDFVKDVVSKLTDDDGLLVCVDEQCVPDPDFSTVSFPNPEESGALDLAMAKADELDIPLVVANDPDADRFSAAVKVDGKWRQLTGNEIGFLFADYVISTIDKQQLNNVCLLNSTVSSQMIGSMAKKLGFHYQDTLTGFKWIGNRSIDYESEGFTVPFAYEEAIGFMFSVVHDKDGISALVIFLQMYAGWLNQGKNALQVLEDGFQQFGFFKECNGYYLLPDLTLTAKIFNETIRASGDSHDRYPKTIGNFDVASWRDLTTGFDSSTEDNKPLLPVDPSSQMITCLLKPIDDINGGEFVRFTARGSGTEPKLKVYIEASAKTELRAAALGREVWDLLKEEWFKPDVHGLVERV